MKKRQRRKIVKNNAIAIGVMFKPGFNLFDREEYWAIKYLDRFFNCGLLRAAKEANNIN